MDPRLLTLFVMFIGMVGCSSNVAVRTAQAGNIYSIHDSKIPGKYALQVTGLDLEASRNEQVEHKAACVARGDSVDDAGPYCAADAEVIAEAIASATREAMDRLAGRLPSSPGLAASKEIRRALCRSVRRD